MRGNLGSLIDQASNHRRSINFEKSLDAQLEKSMSKYKIESKESSKEKEHHDEKILLEYLKPLLINFISNCDFSSLAPRFITRLLHR